MLEFELNNVVIVEQQKILEQALSTNPKTQGLAETHSQGHYGGEGEGVKCCQQQDEERPARCSAGRSHVGL